MRALIAVVLSSAFAHAQAIGIFGTGCGSRPSEFVAYGVPSPGGRVETILRGGAIAPHALFVGASRTSWLGVTLPWTLPVEMGFALGCELLVSPDVVVPLAVDAAGNGGVDFIVPADFGSVFLQVAGLPSTESRYLTRAVAVTFGPAATASVTGGVRRRADAVPVGNARVTLFTPGLSTFGEARSDAAGAFAVTAPPLGRFRFGVAAPGFAYVEGDVDVVAGGVIRDAMLDPETHLGEWRVIGTTAPTTLDATDVSILLPDGRVFYCHDTQDPIVFDPVTGVVQFPAGSGSEQGCTNLTLLDDGSVIQVGGQAGANFRNATRMVKRWSPALGWSRLQDLLHPTGRWYPGLARLADGRLLVMGGGTAPNAARTNTCEVFDPRTGQWQWTGSMGAAVEFPPCGLLYDGRVLRTWGGPELYDVAAGTWRATGAMVAPARGWPGHSDHSLLVLTDRRALIVGVDVGQAGAGASMVEFFDPVAQRWSAGTSPSLRRSQAEVVYLPDGRVFVGGGDVTTQATSEPSLFGIVKRCDVYDPRTDTWRRVQDGLWFREYHAVTLLVPDGRVVTTGGTNIKFRNTPLSADIEAWSPPYLFRGVRPRIDALASTTLTRGGQVALSVFPATALTRVVMLGTGAHTHWVDAGVPRRLELPVQQTGTSVTVALPTDGNEMPAGFYLLFAMVDDVPSVARIVQVR